MTPFHKPVRRVTQDNLGHQFGSDWKRRLVVGLGAGDVISFRPHGSRREVSALAVDLYRYVLRCEANKALLERARGKKEQRAKRLARIREQQARKRLFRQNIN